jgi:hypothetical protein
MFIRIFHEDEADDLRIENADEAGIARKLSKYDDYEQKPNDFEFDVEDYLGRD